MNPSTSRLETLRSASAQRVRREEGPPSTTTPALTKEQIKRRSFWINFAIHGFHFAVWVIFTIWLLNGGGPKL